MKRKSLIKRGVTAMFLVFAIVLNITSAGAVSVGQTEMSGNWRIRFVLVDGYYRVQIMNCYSTLPNQALPYSISTSIGYTRVHAIEPGAYQNNTSIRTLTIESHSDTWQGITSIGYDAFKGCTNLAGIIFKPNFSLTSIGANAFENCKSLTSINLPVNVSFIGVGAFNGCTNLSNIHANGGSGQYFSSQNGVLFNKSATTLIRFPEGKQDKSYTVPSSVKTIDTNAFWNCKNLTSVTFTTSSPPTFNGDFYGCSNLKTIYVPKGAKSAYQKVSALKGFNIVEGSGGGSGGGSVTVTPGSRGDIDGNGKIDISDALEILKKLAGMKNNIKEGQNSFRAADVDRDGKITIQDVLEVLKLLAGMKSLLS